MKVSRVEQKVTEFTIKLSRVEAEMLRWVLASTSQKELTKYAKANLIPILVEDVGNFIDSLYEELIISMP